MRQALHLLIVDDHHHSALVGSVASRWVLPVLTCGERLRADPAALRWANEQGVAGELVGRWLGRLGSDGVDWLLVVNAVASGTGRDSVLAWTPLETLSQTTALLEYQGWAVTTALEAGPPPSRPGPFGDFAWLESAKAWIGESIGSIPSAVIPYRVTAHEVVLGAETDRGRVYFKGLTGSRIIEPRVTHRLAGLAPESFAQTLALDARSDGSVWWLTRHCRGTAGIGAPLVAGALARLQQRVISSSSTLRMLQRVDLSAVTLWALELVDDAACVDVIEQSLDRVTSGGVPVSWIPMDLDPTNALVDGYDVRFIDLDDSYLGPAPLAMAIFANRCRDRSLARIYEQCWSPRLAPVDWPAFAIAAAVIDAWLGWQRLQRNLEFGEVYWEGDFAVQRTRDRLVRAVRMAANDDCIAHRL